MLKVISFLSVVVIAAGSYSDSLSRNKFSALSGAAYSGAPQDCLKNAFSNATLIQQVSVSCDLVQGDTCSGFAAVSHGDKAIILSFRGTTGFMQLVSEGSTTIFTSKIPFAAGGQIAEYFYNGYSVIWAMGLKDSFLKAKNAYRGYDVWVTGHSLGGAFASIAATEIVSLGYVPASKVKLYTFGQPRIGDANFAKAHDNLGFESYRVTHKHDLVAHVPPTFFEGYTHHESEVWYNNDMSVGSSFIECDSDEGETCSDSNLIDYSIDDHLHYFDRSVSGFGNAGCVDSFKKWFVDQKSEQKVNAIWKQKMIELRKTLPK